MVNNTTLIPIRTASYLGYNVTWNSENETVTIKKAGTTDIIQLTVGSKTAYKNKSAIELTVAPQVYANSTYVPLRFISEAFGSTVVWDSKNNGVAVFNPYPEATIMAKSSDLATSRRGVVGLPRVSFQKALEQPEGMTYTYIFPENESSSFYFLKGGSVYYYEVKGEYAQLVWEANTKIDKENNNDIDTFSKYIGGAFDPQVGVQPTISQRLIFFHDNIFVNGTGKFGLIDQNGKEIISHEVRAQQLSEIIVPVPEEEK
ncbi:copper amine oxidase N-terminal domain-containing protein [Desulfoscipio gibsoniae]|uniref:copper amine oxidase N-terminal domain-containing protein n=1 Tax=Desulfoscipio gibsoniae TaxID=102134 RepID=UPI000A01C051|nr:copper amine oxidase N-terminal domain-containing protein [Desulfoscipio gibsoniae]